MANFVKSQAERLNLDSNVYFGDLAAGVGILVMLVAQTVALIPEYLLHFSHSASEREDTAFAQLTAHEAFLRFVDGKVLARELILLIEKRDCKLLAGSPVSYYMSLTIRTGDMFTIRGNTICRRAP
jgi:hypothetical protein